MAMDLDTHLREIRDLMVRALDRLNAIDGHPAPDRDEFTDADRAQAERDAARWAGAQHAANRTRIEALTTENDAQAQTINLLESEKRQLEAERNRALADLLSRTLLERYRPRPT